MIALALELLQAPLRNAPIAREAAVRVGRTSAVADMMRTAMAGGKVRGGAQQQPCAAVLRALERISI